MPSITFDRFDVGLDLRSPGVVQDFSKLQVAQNVFITPAGKLQKRQGVRLLGELPHLPSGALGPVFGLFAFEQLVNFFEDDPESSIRANIETAYTLQNGETIKLLSFSLSMRVGPLFYQRRIAFCSLFNNKYYVIQLNFNSIDTPPFIQHHYVPNDLSDTSPTLVTDSQAPRLLPNGMLELSRKRLIPACQAASHIFVATQDVVRFTADVRDPTIWTATPDENFLPTGTSSNGRRSIMALAVYQDKLVVLFYDAIQSWIIDPDPSKMALVTQLDEVGCISPSSVQNFADDLIFLSRDGFRSLRYSATNSRLGGVDVGTPIDSLVQQYQGARASGNSVVWSRYGQYISFSSTAGDPSFVYNVHKSSKIAGWTVYEFPSLIVPDDADLSFSTVVVGGNLYLQSADRLFYLEENQYRDDGVFSEQLNIACVIESAWSDFQAPGQMKRLLGCDMVCQGNCTVKIGFDIGYPDEWIVIEAESGDSRPRGIIPIEVSGTEFRMRVEHSADELFRFDSITFYYETLGAV